MKRLFTLFLLALSVTAAFAQNDAALAPPNGSISSPVSGCALTNAELVTITVFNFGPGAISNVPVSYTIAGPIPAGPISEVIVGPIAPNTSFTYTFATTANLSLAGTYTISANVALAGDPNGTNDTYSNYTVVNSSASVGGTIAPAAVTTCASTGSGTLTLSGNTGSVVE
ncbi:MAG TPA: hypothetical protein VI112_09700, partial [Bacteroidia bacterium]